MSGRSARRRGSSPLLQRLHYSAHQQRFLEEEPGRPLPPAARTDLFLNPSRGSSLQADTHPDDGGPESRGECHGGPGRWLRWESSAGTDRRLRPAPSSAPACGSAGATADRRSCRTRGNTGVSSESASAERARRETSADTGCSGAGVQSGTSCG